MDNNIIIALALLSHYIRLKNISYFVFPVIYSDGVRLVKVQANGLLLQLCDIVKKGEPLPTCFTIRPNEKNLRVSSRRTRTAFKGLIDERFTIKLPYRTLQEMITDSKYSDIIKPCRKWENITLDTLIHDDKFYYSTFEFVAENINDVDVIETVKNLDYTLRYECKYSEGLMCYGGKVEQQDLDKEIEFVKYLIEQP